jgi:hypothetical protein
MAAPQRHESFFRADPDYNEKHRNPDPKHVSNEDVGNEDVTMEELGHAAMQRAGKIIMEKSAGNFIEFKRLFADFKRTVLEEIDIAEQSINDMIVNSPRRNSRTRKTRKARKTINRRH